RLGERWPVTPASRVRVRVAALTCVFAGFTLFRSLLGNLGGSFDGGHPGAWRLNRRLGVGLWFWCRLWLDLLGLLGETDLDDFFFRGRCDDTRCSHRHERREPGHGNCPDRVPGKQTFAPCEIGRGDLPGVEIHTCLEIREAARAARRQRSECVPVDRKSTRLNSSHVKISYAVFCLKK